MAPDFNHLHIVDLFAVFTLGVAYNLDKGAHLQFLSKNMVYYEELLTNGLICDSLEHESDFFFNIHTRDHNIPLDVFQVLCRVKSFLIEHSHFYNVALADIFLICLDLNL